MTLIAVTGGIGTGKTTVINLFRALGANTADADDIAHSAYLPGSSVYNEMLERWGNAILDENGAVNRKAVAGIVFRDKVELDWLNALVHPFVMERIRELSDGRRLFCAIPLLYESGWDSMADTVVATWCPQSVQRTRLAARGWSESEIDRRLATQMHPDLKLRKGDYGVVTNCSWRTLELQCSRIFQLLE